MKNIFSEVPSALVIRIAGGCKVRMELRSRAKQMAITEATQMQNEF